MRLTPDVARRIRLGHPWIYREALGSRVLREKPGSAVELVDTDGEFVARGIVDGQSAIAVRVVSRDPQESLDAFAIARRVAGAAKLRNRIVDRERFECVRLVNAESDEVPGVVIDQYGEFSLIHLFTEAMEPYVDAMVGALGDGKPTGIYLQRRYKPLSGDAPPGGAELVKGTAAPVELEIREGDLKFNCDVTAPLSTGLFHDLRLGRESIQRWSKGRRVVNLFSYTGAISVYAQHGGATEVCAVDVAAKAHARARRNFTLNGFDSEKPEHIAGDAFKVLAKMKERNRTFDLAVIDPPAFASGSRGGKPWSAVKNYGELVAATLDVLEPEGVLAAVSSTHKLSATDWEQAIAAGASRAGCRLRIVERQGLPPDFVASPGFPEANYLKFAMLVRA
ncbi:MAG: class I SAM-dependent rRNA methyltransferase [Deltaproteobacteria bacterium]|nr:class I SAM-dependent rRNA methyltransferase [Deltaproteobacteria bacterium]